MDIEQFYEADERRRDSEELEFGTEWTDAHNVRYELNWIRDTSELYVMLEPPPPGWEGPFGDIHVNVGDRAPVTGMIVFVLASIATQTETEGVLKGWESAMPKPNSVSWLQQRLQEAGVADPSWAGPRS
jgi:hypothetical protein